MAPRQSHGSRFSSTRNTFPTSPCDRHIIYKRTLANEGVVEQQPGAVVHLPRRSSHLAQVRWSSHIPAAPYMEIKNKKWVTRSLCYWFTGSIAQTSGEGWELRESGGGKFRSVLWISETNSVKSNNPDFSHHLKETIPFDSWSVPVLPHACTTQPSHLYSKQLIYLQIPRFLSLPKIMNSK